jgi:hypothetical protein
VTIRSNNQSKEACERVSNSATVARGDCPCSAFIGTSALGSVSAVLHESETFLPGVRMLPVLPAIAASLLALTLLPLLSSAISLLDDGDEKQAARADRSGLALSEMAWNVCLNVCCFCNV